LPSIPALTKAAVADRVKQIWLHSAYNSQRDDPSERIWAAFQDVPLQEQVVTPGTFNADSVLFDSAGRCYLTDFHNAGIGPVLEDYASLEAIIRFDCAPPQWEALQDLERRLSAENGDVETAGTNQEVGKLLSAVAAIRAEGLRYASQNPPAYQRVLQHHAGLRLLAFDPSSAPAGPARLRLSQIVVFLAHCGQRVRASRSLQVTPEGLVVRDGQELLLTQQQRLLVKHMLGRDWCGSDELLTLLGYQTSQKANLHTAIHRLRAALGGPEQIEEHAVLGYRLPRDGQ